MAARAFYHEYPDTLTAETEVIAAAPGRVLLAQSPLYPGGGGQLADRGLLRWAHGEHAVAGFETVAGKTWILLDDPAAEPSGAVEAVVDAQFRQMMRELHTDTHRSEEHTSELQSLMRISYAVFCLKKKKHHTHR